MKKNKKSEREEYQAIKKEMNKLRGEYAFIMDNMDITGGERGMRNNNKAFRKAQKIKKELSRLNKKLLNVYEEK